LTPEDFAEVEISGGAGGTNNERNTENVNTELDPVLN